MAMSPHTVDVETVLSSLRQYRITVASRSGDGWKSRMDYDIWARTFQVYDHDNLIEDTSSAFVAVEVYNTQTTRKAGE